MTKIVGKEDKGVSDAQLRKIRRADKDPAKRQAKKHKSKRDPKSANRFQAEAPKYSIINGYRFVEPYVYEFRTFAKERWFGRELLDVFVKEFGSNSPEYYKFAIASGRITVNHQNVPVDFVIKNGDLIIHTAHRHEPPVSADEISVLYEDDDLIVVSKPPSIPTHPCGAYRHNSLHSILQATRPDLPQLHILHRLDRLTSGVVLLAKNAAKAKALSLIIGTVQFYHNKQLLQDDFYLILTNLCCYAIQTLREADRQASKTYLARVRGQFPAVFELASQKKLVSEAKARCPASVITFPEEGDILVNCPLRCLSARDGVWECHEEGKPSQTLVRLVRVDKFTSLVKCKPITGRTHQIRLHLQLLGYPIANDPCYGGELHYGESVERAEEIESAKRRKANLPAKDPVDFSIPRKKNESDEEFTRRTCMWCKFGESEVFSESQLHCSKIWLHALEYKLDDQVFKATEPPWAASSNRY